MLSNEQQEKLQNYFYKNGGFVLSSVDKMKNAFPNIPIKDLYDWYSNQEIVQVMRPAPVISEKDRSGESFKPIIAWYPFERLYLDTLFLKEYGLSIVVGLDLFSRYAFAMVFHNKDGGIKSKQALKALLNFFDQIKELGYTLKQHGNVWTDDGGEFKSVFRTHLKETGIPQVVSKVGDTRKNRNIERFNKTLRGLIEKWRNLFGKNIDQKVIDKLIRGYNNSIHSSLNGLTPYEALKDMIKSRTLYNHYVDLKNYSLNFPEDPELKIGTWVRYYVRGNDVFKKLKRNWSKGLHQIEKYYKPSKVYKLDGVKRWFKRDYLMPVDKELFEKYNYEVQGQEKEQIRDETRKVYVSKEDREIRKQPILDTKRQRTIREFFKP